MKRSIALAGAALACAAPAAAAEQPPSAHAAKRTAAGPRETPYDVTFALELTRTWTMDETWDLDCTGGSCHEQEHASGTEHLQLQTPHPQRVTVFSGIRGQPPMINGDTEAVLRLVGHHRLDGVHRDEFSGAWDAANPDQVDDTTQCGDRSVRSTMAFQWVTRNRLGLIPSFTEADALRERCPGDGALENLTGDDGVPEPTLMDVLGDVAQAKVGRVKDFSVRGTAGWHGTVPAIDRESDGDVLHRHGEERLSIQWRATFHQPRKKPHRRRHR
ncbi:MAG TPA: hypothetical protein VFT50_12550 [Baekduia sp.]|nr:hypothetical protein [Baekduia sp.]